MRIGVNNGSGVTQKSPALEFYVNLRVLTVFEMSEIARKRAYIRQGCPKVTTKVINNMIFVGHAC